jgi:hypothetical protein
LNACCCTRNKGQCVLADKLVQSYTEREKHERKTHKSVQISEVSDIVIDRIGSSSVSTVHRRDGGSIGVVRRSLERRTVVVEARWRTVVVEVWVVLVAWSLAESSDVVTMKGLASLGAPVANESG